MLTNKEKFNAIYDIINEAFSYDGDDAAVREAIGNILLDFEEDGKDSIEMEKWIQHNWQSIRDELYLKEEEYRTKIIEDWLEVGMRN